MLVGAETTAEQLLRVMYASDVSVGKGAVEGSYDPSARLSAELDWQGFKDLLCRVVLSSLWLLGVQREAQQLRPDLPDLTDHVLEAYTRSEEDDASANPFVGSSIEAGPAGAALVGVMSLKDLLLQRLTALASNEGSII